MDERQPVPAQNRTAGCGTDSTPELGGRVDTDSVSGGGGRVGTDSTAPVTRDESVESEPICKALPIPIVGTNGIAGQSGASSHDSGNASGQEVPAESQWQGLQGVHFRLDPQLATLGKICPLL